ncbi:VIT and VWA domain-containing protein [bacterium]|nr:VIT and VWA domain-containing protein [bacterium]
MNAQHDNHGPIEELLNELVRETAASQPTDAQWQAAHGRLRRKLAEARMEDAAVGNRGLLWLRFFAYGLSAAAAIAIISVAIFMSGGRSAQAAMSTPGQLIVLDPNGIPAGVCPLEHTDVEANVAGFIARVHVRQTFKNPFDRPIEAVYEFPLPQGSAVDEMWMRIGAREIVGVTREKEEARQIYNAAKAAGQRTALLEQKRPNIFEQSVANIQPGERIEIEIGYTEILSYIDGRFEFVFPMVIAPRYEPRPAKTPDGAPVQTTYADMTTTAPASRSGHDISVTVTIDGGAMQLNQLKSRLHDIDIERPGLNKAVVKLKNRSEIPNRDFVLDYNIIGEEIGDALFLRDDPRGRFFTVILAPPKRVTPKDVVPRELIFVIDQSGSMRGWKIEKAKLAMLRCIQNLNHYDTFNLLSFSSGLARCFEKPVPVTTENVAKALDYLDSMTANGGTEMMPAIREALVKTSDTRTRIVGFMSDGEVGNDFEILSAVRQNAGTTRVFTFGVGDSVNRFLLETMAKSSRGEVQWVTEHDDAQEAADRFYVSLCAPVLSDVKLEWQGIEVENVTPTLLPDLFDRRPVMIHGRIKKGSPSTGTLTLTGITGEGPFRRIIQIPADAVPTDNAALPSLWARSRVDEIMIENPVEIQSGRFSPATREKILGLGLEYHLMTQFTSFVAVEKNLLAPKGEPARIDVPAAAPQGEPNETLRKKAVPLGLSLSASDGSQIETKFVQVDPAKTPIVAYSKLDLERARRIQLSGQNNGQTNYHNYFYAGQHPNQSQVTPAPNPFNATDTFEYKAKLQNQSQIINSTYDPSNGTSSSGDVYKYKDGGWSPGSTVKPAASEVSPELIYKKKAMDVDGDVQVIVQSQNRAVISKDYRGDHSGWKSAPMDASGGIEGGTARYDPTNGTTSYGDLYIGDAERSAIANSLGAQQLEMRGQPKGIRSAAKMKLRSSITSASLGRIVAVIPPERVRVAQKIDPALHADATTSGSDMVFVMVVLTERTSENLKAIQAAGLRIDVATSIAIRNIRHDNPPIVPGWIERGKLMDLAKLKQVRYVANAVGHATLEPRETPRPYELKELKSSRSR